MAFLVSECQTEVTNLGTVKGSTIFRKFFDCKPSMNFWTSSDVTPVASSFLLVLVGLKLITAFCRSGWVWWVVCIVWSWWLCTCWQTPENGPHANHSKVSSSSGRDKCWDPFLLSGENFGSAGRSSPSYDNRFADAPRNHDDEERVWIYSFAAHTPLCYCTYWYCLGIGLHE